MLEYQELLEYVTFMCLNKSMSIIWCINVFAKNIRCLNEQEALAESQILYAIYAQGRWMYL